MDVMAEPELSYRDALRNERLNATDILIASPFIVLVTQFGSALVAQLGASAVWVGLLTSGSALITAVVGFFGPRWIERVPDYRAAVGWPGFIWRFVVLVFPLGLLLPAEWQVQGIVGGVMLLSLSAGLANFSVPAFFLRMTLPDRVARLMSKRWTYLGIGMACCTVPIGWLLDAIPRPNNWFIAAGIAFALSLISMLCLLAIRIGPPNPRSAKRKTLDWAELRAAPAALKYLIVMFGFHCTLSAGGPLVTLRMVRELGATNTDFGIFTTFFWVSSAIGGFFAARLIERFGNPAMFLVSTAGFALHLLMMALAPNFVFTFLAGIGGGIFSALFQVSIYGLMVQAAPEGKYEGYSSWNALVVNASVFIAPLLVTILIDAGLGIVLVMIIVSGLRLLCGGIAWVILRNPPAPSMAS